MTDAEVIQGRLGWEPGDVSETDPTELEAHPKNHELYGDTDAIGDLDESFKESVAENGVLEPLVITADKQIISGHRRWLAATAADLDTVPVRITEFDDDLAEREALIEFNRQREKTPGQIVNEFEEMLAIEKARAKKRKGERTDLEESSDEKPVGNLSHKSDGKERARDKAAEKIDADVSGRTLEKGKSVKDTATAEDEPDPVKETAQQAWDKLQSGEESFNGAHEEVKQARREYEEQQEREARDEDRQESFETADETVRIEHGDFRDVLDDCDNGSVDHIVTDPPYDEDALELWAALGAHAARVLKPGGFLIAYSGKAHLPRIHEVLSSHLQYHWQAIVRHNGPGAKIFSRNLRTGYKPILIYSNGDPDVQEDFVTDVLEGGGREKDDHDWQQAESEAAALVERFTDIDDRICDPMAGSGTVGVACQRLQRRALLIDADRDAIDAIRGRLE